MKTNQELLLKLVTYIVANHKTLYHQDSHFVSGQFRKILNMTIHDSLRECVKEHESTLGIFGITTCQYGIYYLGRLIC